MDINKQKLKSRLNIKFQPIHNPKKSLKKIQQLQAKQKTRNDDSIAGKTKQKDEDGRYIKARSNSQIRLPSLNSRHKIHHYETLQDSKSYVNVAQLRQKAKSYKQIPKVRIQSKQAINNTITYLIKNQILNIPRIIALLQKNESDEFIYLKVTGFYQYQACDSLDKGSSYVTISKNGMVQNQQLIPLQTLVQQFDAFKKLKKIDFFKYFLAFKFLGKWKEGSKKVRFGQNRRTLNKQLNLADPKLLNWKIQIFSLFQIPNQGGWLKGTWMHKLAQNLAEIKVNSKRRMAQICFNILEHFELPISDSTDLMNRVIGNLNGMNITFEKKIRIQKECEKVYILGRQLQLSAMEKVATFILTHLKSLINRTETASNNYKTIILDRLQYLKVQQENYNQQKERILLDSSTQLDLDYTMYYNPEDKILGIRPSPIQLYQDCMSHIKLFLQQMDKIGFKIIRTDQFKFILKSVFKSGLEDEDYQFERNIFRNLVLGMPKYQQLSKNLQLNFHSFQQIFQRRVALAKPFLDLYLSYLDQNKHQGQFTNAEVNFIYTQIEQDLNFCEKLSDGENFVFGYLHSNEFKKQLKSLIRSHSQKLMKKIPIQINVRRNKLLQSLMKHLDVLNGLTDNALSFIKISEQVQIIQQNILDYSAAIDQNEKIIQFYEKVTRMKLNNFHHQKRLLNEIKILSRNFSSSKQNNFSKYRKSLEDQKDNLTKRILSYQVKADAFYDPLSSPAQTYPKIYNVLTNLKRLQSQLAALNNLQTYYSLKLTFISNLQIRINEYQNLQQIWRFSENVDKEGASLMRTLIKSINAQKYIKFYETFKKKTQKYLKDPDLIQITQKCVQKIDKFINDMQTILGINSNHLRQKDIDQISYQIERASNNHNYGVIKCRQLTYQKFTELKVADLRLVISQTIFKAKKELQITHSLNQFNEWWKGIRLDYENLEEFPFIVIFGQNLKIRDQIDQYMTMILNILNNKYGTFVRTQCNQILKKMNNLIEILQLTEIHQQKFLNLFPILTSKYAQNQLSAQCKKFDSILHKTMKNVRVLIKPTQNLNQGTKTILNTNIKQFDSLSKILARFLQKKRVKFQRFYFLQDYELLQVLVGIADQKNVFRMFEGIKGWLVSPEGIKIGVIGVGNEHLVLRGWNYKNIEPQLVFRSLEQAIKLNLNSIVRNVLYQYETEMKQLKQLFEGIPWMCLYAVEMILYAKQVEINCFHNQIPLTAQQSLIRQAINHAAVKPTQFSNYITMLLHLLHFTQQMHKQNVQSIFDFQWHSFLRYYYQKDCVVMRSLSNQIKWGGEYQGLWSLMVNTSDIRRAHICVLNNLQYANGVLLQGPSGTGKTQSLKQLARCTAKYCVIFNCSQNVNLKTMGKLLSGLCYTASWICLDQINRLTLQAMSAIAKQIQTIKNAILTKKQQFNFLGKDIKLKQGVAIFSTMNPIYLKRAKLTQNIKSLFRIITVSMPDSEVILQIMLYGLKFHNPRELAKRIGSAFSNLSVQLSKNPQYDFGLRAMKFLINNLSKQTIQADKQNQAISKAFYDIFSFRLNSTDKTIFQKVIYDVFKYKPTIFNINMETRIKNLEQCPQTGLIVFGPVSIKSMLIKQYCSRFKDAIVNIFNPNSVDLRYFLGESIHGRWQQGIVQKIARSSLSCPDKMHLLVLDSTLKSQIIQNFNTLLDESKLLTLSNGTRLKIQNNLKVVMETPHLNLTSPSTITRCNVIYVSDKDVQTKQLIQAQFPTCLMHQPSLEKIRTIYSKFNNNQIRQIGQLSKIIMGEQFVKNANEWRQNQILGIEKAVVFAARILGFQAKIQQLIKKQNSFSLKKLPFHHILIYNRYAQGEFIQISRTYQPIIEHQSFMLRTSQQIFIKWLTTKAIIRQRQPILWKSCQFTGISTSLRYSLRNHKYMKIAMNNDLGSAALVRLLLPQMLDKKFQQIKQEPQLVIYLQNLHMSNQQVSQQIRFMMEHNKLFSVQAKQVVSIQAMAFISESRHFQNKQNDRVRRHFSQISVPFVDQIEIKNIYGELIKYYLQQTNLPSTLKNSINMESERISTFISTIFQRKNLKQNSQNNKKGIYYPIRILQRIKVLNEKNCKQINDFIAFMFQSIKLEQNFSHSNDPQLLIQAFHEFYKGKFVKQFDNYLKNSCIILQNENIIKSQKKKKQLLQQSGKTFIKQQLLFDTERTSYPEFVISQIELVLRILQKNSSNYCLLGEECSGRKTIFRLACKVGRYNYIELPQNINQNAIQKIYFEKLKQSFQRKTKQIIIMDLKWIQHKKFLRFAENVAIGQSAITLFDNQETDYMFANILEHAEVGYTKSSKSYDQVCQDYVNMAHKNIQFLIASSPQNSIYLQQFPTLQRNTYFRNIKEFPLQSVIQGIDTIIQSKLKLDSYLRQSQSIQSLPRVFMKIYKIFYNIAHKNKQNNIHHFNFNQFHIFKVVELFCQSFQKTLNRFKENQDILNRSISKMVQTTNTLQSLKQKIMKMQPQISARKQRILQVVPLLQQKKRKTQAIKYSVQSQRKQIETKQLQIQSIMQEVKDQIDQATPLLNQAVESIQTVKRSDLSQIKNNMNPHPLIKFTMENMVILFGENQNWQNIKKILSDANLLVRIKNCHPSQQSYLKVKKRIQQNPEWTFDMITKISYGSRYLFKWIKSIIKYKDIQQQIQKKKQYVQKLKISLKNSEEKAQQKMNQLNERQKDSIQIQIQYSKIKKQLNDLQDLMDRNKRKMNNAEKIKDSLKQSVAKWESKLGQSKQIKYYLNTYCIFLCIQIKVFPSLTIEQHTQSRQQIIKVFMEEQLVIPKDVNIYSDILNFEDKTLFSQLSHQDLKQNKKIMLAYHFYKKPIIIDPDNQATNWISNMNWANKIVYTKRSFNGAAKIAEDAMRNGDILFILIDEQIDSFCQQILKSLQSCRPTNRNLIQYNNNLFSVHNDFTLLFISKSKTSKISMKSSLNFQVINFEITKQSIHQSLLKAVLKKEKPDLYQMKSRIQQTIQQISKNIMIMESEIVNSLLSNKKDLIQDDSFVELLTQSKKKQQFFQMNKKEQQNRIAQVDLFMSQFSQICRQSADVYISLKEVSKINSNLIWDVEIFIQYFVESCQLSISNVTVVEQNQQLLDASFIGAFQFQEVQRADLSRPGTAISGISFSASQLLNQQQNQQSTERVNTIPNQNQPQQNVQQLKNQQIKQTPEINKTFEEIFNTIIVSVDQTQRGFVNQDRFFSIKTHLLNFIKKSMTNMQRNVWALLLSLKDERKEDLKCLISLFLAKQKKKNLLTLINQGIVTQGIKNHFMKIDTNNIETECLKLILKTENIQQQIQEEPKNPLTQIEMLIIGYSMYPQRFLTLVEGIIHRKKLRMILDYEQLRVIDWIKQYDSIHPTLLFMGEDPVSMISQFLQRKKYKNATLVAMGDDQGRGLDLVIQKQSRKQGIFIIHNIHIAINFIPTLSRIIQQFHYKPPHKNFRLVLISSIQASLPEQITSLCHKYIVEQPSGLKNKMKGLYKKTQLYIDHSETIQHKLSYSLCFMHSLINQMQKYGTFCWNFPQSFTTDDFLGSLLAIKSIFNQKNQSDHYQCNIDPEQVERDMKTQSIDFKALRYLIGQTCYIGKMSDNIDRNKMRIIVQNHFNQHILKHNYKLWQGDRISQDPSQVTTCIQNINQQNSKTYGLHQGTSPSKQISQNLLNQLINIYQSNLLIKSQKNTQKFDYIKPICHKLGFINSEIQSYNLNGVYQPHSRLLRQITQKTYIFNLRAFSNPKQLFIYVKIQAAIKNNVAYDGIAMVWSIGEKESCFGISNLTLEGACLKNGLLIAGSQQKQITLFFTPVVKKRQKDPNKGKAIIPLYLNEQRGQSIGTYGQNTNLLTEIYLDSKEQQDTWIIKGTAFIVS